MTTTTEQRPGTNRQPEIVGRRLTAADIRALDPYQLMAELGKTVIHPGGGRSTEEPLAMAAPKPGQRVLDAGSGIGTTAAQIARSFNCEVIAVMLGALASTDLAMGLVFGAGLGWL